VKENLDKTVLDAVHLQCGFNSLGFSSDVDLSGSYFSLNSRTGRDDDSPLSRFAQAQIARRLPAAVSRESLESIAHSVGREELSNCHLRALAKHTAQNIASAPDLNSFLGSSPLVSSILASDLPPSIASMMFFFSGINPNMRVSKEEFLQVCALARCSDLRPLKETLAEKFLIPSGYPLPSDPDKLDRQMAISRSSSLYIYAALVDATLKPGDVVLVPQGSFGGLFTLTLNKDLNTLELPVDTNSWKLTADGLRGFFKDRQLKTGGMLILTNPTNPGGLVYSSEELLAIADVCKDVGILLTVDELYSQLPVGTKQTEKFVHAASLPEISSTEKGSLHSSMVTVWGTSKLLGMTTLSIGVAISGDEELIARINSKLEDNNKMPRIIDEANHLYAIETNFSSMMNSSDILAERYYRLMSSVEQANFKLGEEVFKLWHAPDQSFFTLLGIDRSLLTSVGVLDHFDLFAYLLSEYGLEVGNMETMRPPNSKELWTRVNYSNLEADEVEQFNRTLFRIGSDLLGQTAPFFECCYRDINFLTNRPAPGDY